MTEGSKTGFLGLAADCETPIEHLDYNYIGKCNNVKEIEKILKILRSGKDGFYPELIEFTEKRLEQVNPKSKLLRKEMPLKTYRDLDQSYCEKIKDDMKDWTEEMSKKDTALKSERSEMNSELYHHGNKNSLPPIRSTRSINSATSETERRKAEDEIKKKKVVPRDYKEWDRFDADKALDEQEQKEKETKNEIKHQVKSNIPEKFDNAPDGIAKQEREFRAVREKDKGNDAFRSGDFEESVVYYSRSISLLPTAAAFNNRAAAKIQLKKYQDAIDDCEKVLDLEPDNLKAFLRRGIAYKEIGHFDKSNQDIQQVLKIEPSNKRAKEILDSIKKLQKTPNGDTSDISATNKPKKKGQRLKIVEVDGEDEEDQTTQAETNGLLNEKPIKTGAINGAHDFTKDTTNSSRKAPELQMQNNSCVEFSEKEVNCNVTPLAANTKDNLTSSVSLGTSVKTNVEMSSNNKEKKDTDRLDSDLTNGLQKGDDNTGDTNPSPNFDSSQTPKARELPLPGLAVKAKDEGIALFRNGRFAEALEKYSTAIDILWKDKDSYQTSLSVLLSNRAACHYKIGDCDGCIEDCNKALVLTPSQTKPRCRRAAALETKEKYIEAYNDFQSVLAADPFNKAAQEANSRIVRHLKSVYGASWREKIHSTPSTANPTLEIPVTGSRSDIMRPLTINSQSSTKSASGAPMTAAAPIRTLSDEEKFGQLKEKGNTFVKKGKYSEAVDCYTQCIAICPREVASYTNRALCYLKLSKPDLSESDSSEALKLQSDNVKALFRRALARKALKQFDNAAKDLVQLLKIEPKNAAGKKELDVVLELCREKRRTVQKQEVKNKEKTSPGSGTRLPPDEKPGHKKDAVNQKKKQPIKRKRIQIQEVEADEEDTEEEKVPVANPEQHPFSNGPIDSSNTSQATGTTSLKQVKPEAAENKKSPTQKQSHAPSIKKATGYEFLLAWNSVSKDDVKGYAAILEQIQPKSLPKVLSNTLDADMLKIVVKAMLQYLLPEGKADLCYRILKNLCHAQRFSMVLLFLAEKDKKDLNSLFSKLEASHSKKPFADVKDLKNLRKTYAL